MEIKFDFKTILISALVLMLFIGALILNHQNNAIRSQNDAMSKLRDTLRQEQVDDSLQQVTDSIKFKQLQLKTYSDSMATAKLYRDRELELIKKLTKKKIIKYEDIIKDLPNSNTAVRDSIWKSELTKSEQLIK